MSKVRAFSIYAYNGRKPKSSLCYGGDQLADRDSAITLAVYLAQKAHGDVVDPDTGEVLYSATSEGAAWSSTATGFPRTPTTYRERVIANCAASHYGNDAARAAREHPNLGALLSDYRAAIEGYELDCTIGPVGPSAHESLEEFGRKYSDVVEARTTSYVAHKLIF